MRTSRAPYHGLCPQRPRPPTLGRDAAQIAPTRLSDLILAVLGVAVLGGLALAAAHALAAHALAAHALAAASMVH